MASAQQLLKEASGTTEVGFSAKTEAFLQAAGKSHLGHEEAKLFFRFIQQCLHTFMTKLKNLKDVGQVKEILKTSIVCGQAYTHLQHCVEEDKTHTVPSILFYIVRSLQDSVHVYAKYIITVSEMVYEMLDAAGCPKTSHTILGAFHSFLWNTSAKALEKGSSQGLKDVLMFRKMSLLFVCCVPLNNNKNLPLFQYTISHYTQFKREWIDKGTIDTFYSIFQCVFDRLKRLQNTLETDEDKSACRLFLLQIHVLLVEYLLKISDYSKARDIIEVMNEKCPLIISVKDVYSYTADCLEAFKNSQKPNISSVKLRETNNFIKQCIESEPRETLKPLIAALTCFTQSFSSKVLVSLETSLVKELSVSCKLVQTMCQKLPLESPKSGKTSDNKKEKELATEKVNCVSACLQSYFKQLQLLHKLLDDDTGLEVFQECTDVSEKFQQYIEANHSQIPENTLSSHRYNIGYICNLIGVLCMHAGHYDMAASLYTVVVNQLHKCQQPQPQLIKMFEKLVDCYIEQEKWTEATQAVVKAFTAVEGDILPIAIIWTRLKKDASSKDEIFQSLTLKTVIESSGVELKGVTCRKLLIVEYEAWKLYSRRRYDTEYHIFCELLEATQTPAQKAEAMVALATTMCITGGTYKNMSAGEMLNKAIIALDKNGTSSERILALANYTKYALLHEEAIEYMKNENGELLYFGTGDLSANSRFTLQQEQDNLPFLVRAIELWEKSLAHKSQKSSKGGEKVSKETTISDENLFGLEHHIDNLIMCGTRLIAMKQPQLALRALQVVKDQLPNLKDSKRALDLSLQVTRSLMLLGRYKEAESVIDGTGDNKKQTRPTSMSLLMSELYMFIGKRDKGLEILQSVLDSKEFLGKTQKIYLMQGTAKRLLSMALCLPGGDHMINSTNQYLLYLAFEAVQCHVTVVNFLTQNKSFEKNSDKWLILNEILSSLLHLCQLCRFIGLPREALCYLKAGLNISQGQGLPRWSCEFLMEMLGVQSMEAEYEKALSTAESLDCILSSENQSKDISLNQSTKGCKRESQSTDDQLCKSSVSQAENFGFEDLATPAVKPSDGTLDKTPERLYKKEELDSEKKNKMKKLKAPNCSCMVADCDQCPDLVRHRLCMKAGIVLSDFLAQTDMRSAADILLTDIQSKFEILSDICSDSTNSLNDFGLPNEKSLVKNGHIHDPQLLYTCLEAGCIKAESYLHQKDFNKVHQVWKTFQNLEKSGSLKNVLHSNILLTRLALCDASGYMLSLHESQTKLNQSETGSRINQSDIDKKMEDTTQKLENLSIKPRRKVSFEGEDESWTITGTCMKIAKKITKFAEDMMSPVAKSVMDSVNTPKSQFIAKKSKVALTTPATNRMMVLEQLMASDEEDDMLVFPEPKPVTPRVAPKSSKSSRIKSKCKTEPRNPSCKKPAFTIAEDPVDEKSIACKLNFPQTSDDMSGSNTVDNSHVEQSKRKPRKMKKEKCNSTSAINDTEGQTDEDVDSKDKTRKSGIPKRSGRKPVGDKIKNVEKSTENSIVMLNADESNKTGNSINVLREKGADGDTGQLEKLNSGLNQIKNDVFDFGLEASPVVAKVSKTGRGKQTKGSQRGKKASGVPRKPSNEDEQNVCMEVDNKENESIPRAKTSSRRGRPKRGPDNTEMVRKNSDELDECELEISLEELTLDDDRYSDIGDNDTERARDVSLPEPVIEQGELVVGQLDDIEVKLDIDLEPIEIMRGETVPKSKAGNKSRKRGKAVAAKADDAYEEDTVGTTESKKEEGSSSGEDSHDTSRTVEKMRSGRLASMNELTHMDLMDEPRVSCVEMDASEDRSPCGSDIISSLECLYERLCKFPPNPQHSDVCHMLALHYLDTDPQRAAFLLSDAMAVTFRHQVLLNLGRKAKRESKSSCASVSKAGHVQDGMLFSGDDLKLSDMVKSIPEDWCVVQLSVVSVGLPWKQMILTRFVKDEEPVILKLPGFSSPQGRHILKDFSTLLEQNADSAKIESTTEWWSTRRKLDTDMENLVDRIEKHWLGCWRCAVLPGEFSEKTLDLACNDVNKITKKVVTRKDIELLLLAHKAGTEKEIGQCITDILGVHSSNIDSIVSILKKYSNKGTDKKDNQHKILILDKTVQHLPWESIPILSDKSVSRMPCLSHLVTQLNNLQTQKKSVFLKGVNPRNTFYILNPDSDLPRTQDFFKDWFESEKGWTGVIGCRPSSEQFIDALTNKDFLIFCGHGSGGRIFSSDEIEKLTARAVTMLMGCSSGRLLVKGQLEPSGMMISYFLAGCPSMVANLWDVTDKDIDKFTENLIKTWMSSNHGTYLTKLVQSSRAVCKLKYLNGLAPVVYGLPVFINKGKK